MSSLKAHIARLRWRSTAHLGRWVEGFAAYMPDWALHLLLGDARVIVLSDEAGELRAELRPFASRERSSQRAILHDGSWVPESAWQILRRAERTCPVILILPQTLTLAHEIRVPLTALESLEGTVRHGITTWTPFAPEEVHVSAHPRAVVGNQLVVDLRYALRDRVRALLDAFSAAGIRADRVSLDGRIAGAAIIDSAKGRRIHRQHLIDGVLLATALLLILASGTRAWWRQDRAIADLQAVTRSETETSQAQEATRGKSRP